MPMDATPEACRPPSLCMLAPRLTGAASWSDRVTVKGTVKRSSLDAAPAAAPVAATAIARQRAQTSCRHLLAQLAACNRLLRNGLRPSLPGAYRDGAKCTIIAATVAADAGTHAWRHAPAALKVPWLQRQRAVQVS
jgi:hypothetical protein